MPDLERCNNMEICPLEICPLYCTDDRKLCDEASDCDLLFSIIAKIQSERDSAVIEATVDNLTGLLNKNAFFKEGQLAVDEAELGGDPFGVIMLDITNFKAYNDTSGHLAGDALLAKVGGKLKNLLRGDDYISARFGGDEFVMLCRLLPHDDYDAQTTNERLLSITTRLHNNIGELLAIEGEYLFGAFGCKVWQPGETFEDILVAADCNMYEAKRRQKNISDPSNDKYQ